MVDLDLGIVDAWQKKKNNNYEYLYECKFDLIVTTEKDKYSM